MWTVVLRDGTGAHPLATTTRVDKTAFPTQPAAVAQAAKQLGVIAIGTHCWWEIF
jgi:hypothetical protein